MFFLLTVAFSIAQESFSVGAGGDVAFGRYLKHTKQYRPHGGTQPFQTLKPLFQQVDMVFCNLETPLSDEDPHIIGSKRPLSHSLTFRADTRYAQLMQSAGVQLLSLSNNHMEDCNKNGLAHTIKALDQAGIHHAGAHLTQDPYAPKVLTHKDVDIVFFARSTKRNKGRITGLHPYVAFATPKHLLEQTPEQIKAYKKAYPKALIMVSIHWGGEYMTQPVRIQRTIARKLIDAGAHIILGHHPHVLQPVEVHKHGVIVYSMGNFIFDQNRPKTHISAFFLFDFIYQQQWFIKRVRLIPLKLSPPPLPTQMGEVSQLEQFRRDSAQKEYHTPFQYDENSLLWEAEPIEP